MPVAMGGIRMTTKEKISYLKTLFPKKKYSLLELMDEFKVSRDTIYYWIEMFSIGRIKINATTFLTQDSLILLILKAEMLKGGQSEEKQIGIAAAAGDSELLRKVIESPHSLKIPISSTKCLTSIKKYDKEEE